MPAAVNRRVAGDTPADTSAFTLIELLVVMAIIIVLAGLILSTMGYVKKKAPVPAPKLKSLPCWQLAKVTKQITGFILPIPIPMLLTLRPLGIPAVIKLRAFICMSN